MNILNNKRKIDIPEIVTKKQKQNDEYKCYIYLSGISNHNFIIYLEKKYFNHSDTSSIYNIIYDNYSNNWTDMCINSIEYHKNNKEVIIHITTYNSLPA